MMNVNVLIVEDSKSVLSLITYLLQSNGFHEIQTAISGEEAVKLIETEKFNLIIMDIELAGKLDGIDVAEIIKQKYDVPIILITARQSHDHIIRAESLGIYSYLVKPISEIMLISHIRLTLNRYQLEQQMYKSELRFRSIFEHMYDGFLYGNVVYNDLEEIKDFKIVDANRSFYKIIDKEPMHVAGKCALELFPVIHKYYPDWKKVLKKFDEDNDFHSIKLKLEIRKRIYVLFFYRVIDRTIACVIEDLTGKIKTEKYIQYTKEKYELLFNSSYDAHVILDDRKIIDCNKATLKIFGISNSKEILGKSPVDFSPELQPDGMSSEYKAKQKLQEAISSGHSHFNWLHKRNSGDEFYADVTLSGFYRDEKSYVFGTIRDIDNEIIAQKELNDAHKQIRDLVGAIDSILIGVGIHDQITHWSKQSENLLNITYRDCIDKRFFDLKIEWEWEKIFEAISNAVISKSKVSVGDIKYKRSDNTKGFIGMTISPILDDKKKLCGYLIFGNDITHKRELELEVFQSQKLRSIGEMAAGIAHEINTPIQYVHDNTLFFKESCNKLKQVLIRLIKNKNQRNTEEFKPSYNEIYNLIEELDLEYYLNEVPIAVEQTLEGINHIIKIVKSMKSFSHPDDEQMKLVDINKSIEDIKIISRNEWKYVADCNTELDISIPEILCFPADMNQVFLNLIVNAAHAIKDAIDSGKYTKGSIIIKNRLIENKLEVTIQDNALGIDKKIQDRIFDPFFTTKEVGKGTGQGLAISYSIVVNKHHGELFFKTQKRKGTTFYILIPLKKKDYINE